MSITFWTETVSWGVGIVKANRRALAERREVMGHTQETLAEFVGVETTTVAPRWGAGNVARPSPTVVSAHTCRRPEGLAGRTERHSRRGQPVEGTDGVLPSEVADELIDDPEQDRVLSAPWSHRGTVEAAVVLKCGDRPVKRRHFVFLTGATLRPRRTSD